MPDYTMTDDTCRCGGDGNGNPAPLRNEDFCIGCGVYHHTEDCRAGQPVLITIRTSPSTHYCVTCGRNHETITYPQGTTYSDIITLHTTATRDYLAAHPRYYCDECNDYYEIEHNHEPAPEEPDEPPDEPWDERYCNRCSDYYGSDHRHFSRVELEANERSQNVQRKALQKINSEVLDPRPEEPNDTHENCQCETCKMGRFESSKLKSAIILSYGYEPSTWILHSTYRDKDKYYLGVELETDNFTSRGKESDISMEIAADMKLPEDFWIPKEDSSISGPEFVSHPATLAYWRELQPELEEMFKMLLHAGYRSHDNDNCGMHVNISRNAFDDSKHLYRFMTLIHLDPSWSVRMSQRSRDSANTWAKLGPSKRTKFRDITSKIVFGDKDQEYIDINNHGALNFPDGENGKRFEFRLPRGTLRIDRFYKNLEWTHAMIEYTRDHRLLVSRPGAFMEWVNSNDYPYLAAFIEEKFVNKKVRAA